MITFAVSILLPIDKLIGRIYPVFGFALLFTMRYIRQKTGKRVEVV